ncbi:MAG TPA: hypothetical protein VFQ77_06530 [Pseudonocardiaceae bacterium]|jgi:hypothetical protein|nr:hypothetical protein [Pseudonocardiaceae bacterium]
MFVTELLRREGRAGEQALPARPTGMYRAVAAVAGFVLLCGATLAGAAVLSGPRTPRPVPSGTVLAAIAGAEVLRPDLLNTSITFPSPAAPRSAAGADGRPPGSGGRPPTTTPEPPTNLDENPPRRMLDPILSTVTAFYDIVTVSPRQAFGLLDPQMQGSSYHEFRNAWSEVERVTVGQIRPDGPTTVLVAASLERKDGSVLHTLQRVEVIPGAQPRITDARLLSASRS